MNTLASTSRLTDETYLELVKSLFATLLPTLIMGVSFLMVGGTAILEANDELLFVLFVVGACCILARVAVLLSHRTIATATQAGRAERRFAAAYLSFALVFGLFTARAFPFVQEDVRLLLVGLIFGYGAGVAAGISMRPWICVPAVLLAIVPPTITIAIIDDQRNWGLALLIAVFLAGGIESMLARFASTAKRLTLEHMLSMVRRRDELTGLPNQLALFRYFDELASAPSGAAFVAVHVLEFSGFEQINADFGYPRGDELLKAVAERIERLMEPGSYAARLGGAAFVIVQPSLFHHRQAEALAGELHDGLAQPYAIAGGILTLTLHVGCSIDTQRGARAEEMLLRARIAVDRARTERLAVMMGTRDKWGLPARKSR